jgi:hypothetical protein
VEVGTKLDPVTVRVNAELPAMAGLGLRETMAGKGLLIVYGKACETPPPGGGLTTVIEAVPPLAISEAVIEACRLVLEI